jgi:hypothetical protein
MARRYGKSDMSARKPPAPKDAPPPGAGRARDVQIFMRKPAARDELRSPHARPRSMGGIVTSQISIETEMRTNTSLPPMSS